MVRSPDCEKPSFDMTTRVLHGDKLARFIYIIGLHYILTKSVYSNLHPDFTLTTEKAIDTQLYILPILTI